MNIFHFHSTPKDSYVFPSAWRYTRHGCPRETIGGESFKRRQGRQRTVLVQREVGQTDGPESNIGPGHAQDMRPECHARRPRRVRRGHGRAVDGVAGRRVPPEGRRDHARLLPGLHHQLPVFHLQNVGGGPPLGRPVGVPGREPRGLHAQLPRLRRARVPQMGGPVGARVVRVRRGRRRGAINIHVQPVPVQQHGDDRQARGRHVLPAAAQRVQPARDGVRADVRRLFLRVLRGRGDHHVLVPVLHRHVRRARRIRLVLVDVSAGNHMRRDRIVGPSFEYVRWAAGVPFTPK